MGIVMAADVVDSLGVGFVCPREGAHEGITINLKIRTGIYCAWLASIGSADAGYTIANCLQLSLYIVVLRELL
jgi:hypothetical protein